MKPKSLAQLAPARSSWKKGKCYMVNVMAFANCRWLRYCGTRREKEPKELGTACAGALELEEGEMLYGARHGLCELSVVEILWYQTRKRSQRASHSLRHRVRVGRRGNVLWRPSWPLRIVGG